MQEEQIKQELYRIQQDMHQLQEEFGDVSNTPCTLEVGQSKSGLYLSTQQIDLLLLVNVSTPEELAEFVSHCVQLSGYEQKDVTMENLEEKKREVFRAYLDSFVSFKELAPREGFDAKASQLRRVDINLRKNLPSIYYEAAKEALMTGGEQGLVQYLATIPNGQMYLTAISRFMSLDYENIREVTYEEIVGLDDLIKRDPTIDTLVNIGAKYDMTMHYGLDGKKYFDSYYLDRALAYSKMTNKHMRFHSLFDRSNAMDFKDKGYSREQVMSLLQPFVDGYFSYLTRHDEVLSDGSRLINSAEIFNELLTYEPGTLGGKKTGMVWQDYFGMSMEDLFSFLQVDGISRVPEGVDVMYNETALEEGPERLESCASILRSIQAISPGFINVFGNQLHVYDSLFHQYDKMEESTEFLKRVQDEMGIRVQITEHDLNINGYMVDNCHKYGVPKEYLRLLKRKYQQRLSQTLSTAGLNIDSVDYWSIYDRVDHNLRRTIEGRIANGEDISHIPSLFAGLIPERADMHQIPSLNPKADAYVYQMADVRKKTLDYPTETGSISVFVILTIMSFILFILLFITFIIL